MLQPQNSEAVIYTLACITCHFRSLLSAFFEFLGIHCIGVLTIAKGGVRYNMEMQGGNFTFLGFDMPGPWLCDH